MGAFLVPLEIGAYAIGIIGLVGGVYGFFRYADYKNTVQLQNDSIKALQENNAILKSEIETTKADRITLNQRITVLTNEVLTYKNLQLDKIATALSSNVELLAKLASSNDQILNTLRTSAIIAKATADDGGVLIHTEDKNPLAIKQGVEGVQ